jgi:hypothetical protein
MADDIRRDERDQALPSTRDGVTPSDGSQGLGGSPSQGSEGLGAVPRESSPDMGSSPFEPARDLSSSPSERSHDPDSTPTRASPLGTHPQEAQPLPGDPREAQEPQEPRSTHIGAPGRHDSPVHEGTGSVNEGEDRGVVDQLKDAWDKMRGKKN